MISNLWTSTGLGKASLFFSSSFFFFLFFLSLMTERRDVSTTSPTVRVNSIINMAAGSLHTIKELHDGVPNEKAVGILISLTDPPPHTDIFAQLGPVPYL